MKRIWRLAIEFTDGSASDTIEIIADNKVDAAFIAGQRYSGQCVVLAEIQEVY